MFPVFSLLLFLTTHKCEVFAWTTTTTSKPHHYNPLWALPEAADHHAIRSTMINDDDDGRLEHGDEDTPLSFFSSRRRSVLALASCSPVLASTTAFLVSAPQPSAALSTGSAAGETIRRSAAKLPGLGPPDVYYPPSWRGTFKATRTILVPNIGLTLEYKVRFIDANLLEEDKTSEGTESTTTSPNNNNNNALIIADRGFNQAQLETALKRQQQQATSNPSEGTTASAAVVVQTVEWDKGNPNDLRLILVDGTRKEIKVTKRATTLITPATATTTATAPLVQSSEFQRITVEQPTTSMIPSISARRVQSQWKETLDGNDNQNSSNNSLPQRMEGLELVYDMGSNLDPMSSSGPAEPKLLTKSRILLERIS